ncbi:Dolichyl-diphosphooligosaccharide-protein glycosyltransferase subunit dad1 [Cytospora paraplurivora]|uniref:DASH complex subunit DAD1 n=1 Tax=Cytospora paraplurivora TaxID=2898453 RepID=A0AAN9YLI2_9PEZI
MATTTSTSTPASRAYFEQQRGALIGEIATSFEHVLANINKLNRNLEAVIAVGNEFSSVEALWSTFETVMAKEEGEGEGQEGRDDNKHAEARGYEEGGDEQQHGGGGGGVVDEDEDVEMADL